MRGEVGCAGLVVDTKEGARSFYDRYGFVELEAEEGMALALPRPVPVLLPLGSIPRRSKSS